MILIRVEPPNLLRPAVSNLTATAATARRVTLTCVPTVNKVGVDILPVIEVATGPVRITDHPVSFR